jgi:hypothetical protein
MERTFLLYRPAKSDMCDALLKVGHLAQPILWTANPSVRAGDRCLIYSASRKSSIVGAGIATSDPFKINTGEWTGAMCIFLRLVAETNLPLNDMRKNSRWSALRGRNALKATRFGPYGRGAANAREIPSPHAEVLWRLALDRAAETID